MRIGARRHSKKELTKRRSAGHKFVRDLFKVAPKTSHSSFDPSAIRGDLGTRARGFETRIAEGFTRWEEGMEDYDFVYRKQ